MPVNGNRCKLVHEMTASKNQKISVFVDIVETEIIRASQETKIITSRRISAMLSKTKLKIKYQQS